MENSLETLKMLNFFKKNFPVNKSVSCFQLEKFFYDQGILEDIPSLDVINKFLISSCEKIIIEDKTYKKIPFLTNKNRTEKITEYLYSTQFPLKISQTEFRSKFLFEKNSETQIIITSNLIAHFFCNKIAGYSISKDELENYYKTNIPFGVISFDYKLDDINKYASKINPSLYVVFENNKFITSYNLLNFKDYLSTGSFTYENYFNELAKINPIATSDISFRMDNFIYSDIVTKAFHPMSYDNINEHFIALIGNLKSEFHCENIIFKYPKASFLISTDKITYVYENNLLQVAEPDIIKFIQNRRIGFTLSKKNWNRLFPDMPEIKILNDKIKIYNLEIFESNKKSLCIRKIKSKKSETKKVVTNKIKSESNSEKIFINNKEQHLDEFNLYVYKSLNKIHCNSAKTHDPENVTIRAKNMYGDFVQFNVFHCKKCNKYYTNLESVQNKFEILKYPFVKMTFETFNSSDLNEKSELAIYGYNVKQDGLSEYERRKLLSQLLQYGFLSKYRIISILQFNINFHNGKNLSAARKKWEEDMKFVETFDLNNQTKITANKVNIL